MMKRIIAALSGKIEKMKMERKVNRVNRAIESATDNARDAIERIEEEKTSLLVALSTATDVNCIVQELGDKIGEQEEQQQTIERLEKIREYINEDVRVEEPEKD